MSSAIIAAAVLLAAPAGEVRTSQPAAGKQNSASAVRELRSAVTAALREEATAKTAEQRGAAIRKLVALAKSLREPAGVTRADAASLSKSVQTRLARIHREATARSTGKATAPRSIAPGQPGILAQVAPGAPPPGAERRAIGDDLVELIEETIAPETWNVRGGNGVIVFWRAGNALVVRQVDDEHHALGDLLRQFGR